MQKQQCFSRIYSPVIGETLSLISCIYWETAWHSRSWICCLSWQLPAWSWHKPKMQDWPQSWWGVGLHSSLCGAHLTQASPPRPWQLGVVWQCQVRERGNVVEQELLHRAVVQHRRYFTYCCLQKQGIRSVMLFLIKKKSCSCIDLVLVRAVSLSRVSTCRNVPSVGQSQTDVHWNAVQTWKLKTHPKPCQTRYYGASWVRRCLDTTRKHLIGLSYSFACGCYFMIRRWKCLPKESRKSRNKNNLPKIWNK